jgi:superfamily II DNA or RNA helicase
VLPTGSGKTLVAAMILGRMGLLNKDRLGLVIVDRVPLVYQHADSIRSETHLRVMGLRGGYMSRLRMKQVCQKHVDVLVITAGAYYEHLEDLPIELFHTVILDECHHTSKY